MELIHPSLEFIHPHRRRHIPCSHGTLCQQLRRNRRHPRRQLALDGLASAVEAAGMVRLAMVRLAMLMSAMMVCNTGNHN